MDAESDQEVNLVRRAAAGDQGAWEDLCARYHDRLLHIVSVRLDRRAQGRIDPSDVLQDSYLEAFRCLTKYLQDVKTSFFVWLRSITYHNLQDMHRRELGAEKRDARREVSLYGGSFPETSSDVLADHLIDSVTGPSTAVMRDERRRDVQRVLANMDPLDREAIMLRHFEQLSSSEAAEALGIKPPAARKRYQRALQRIKEVLSDLEEHDGRS